MATSSSQRQRGDRPRSSHEVVGQSGGDRPAPDAVVEPQVSRTPAFTAREGRIWRLDEHGAPIGEPVKVTSGSLQITYGGMPLIETDMPRDLRPLRGLTWRFSAEFVEAARATVRAFDQMSEAVAEVANRLRPLRKRFPDALSSALDRAQRLDELGVSDLAPVFESGGSCEHCGEEFATAAEALLDGHPCVSAEPF